LEVGADVVTVLVDGKLLSKFAVSEEEEESLSVINQIKLQDETRHVRQANVVSGLLFCLQGDGVVGILLQSWLKITVKMRISALIEGKLRK